MASDHMTIPHLIAFAHRPAANVVRAACTRTDASRANRDLVRCTCATRFQSGLLQRLPSRQASPIPSLGQWNPSAATRFCKPGVAESIFRGELRYRLRPHQVIELLASKSSHPEPWRHGDLGFTGARYWPGGDFHHPFPVSIQGRLSMLCLKIRIARGCLRILMVQDLPDQWLDLRHLSVPYSTFARS